MRGDQFEIGKIEILKSFSFFEIEHGFDDNVLKAFKKGDHDGQKLLVEKSQPKPVTHHRKTKKTKNKKRARAF